MPGNKTKRNYQSKGNPGTFNNIYRVGMDYLVLRAVPERQK